MIEFIVPAVPVAQPRQRTRVGSVNGKLMAMNYTPTNSPVNDFKATVRMAAAAAHSGAPLDGVLHLWATFVMPRPKSRCWKTKPTPRYWHSGKPDVDNLTKSLCDALSGLLFLDDKQIAWLNAQKLVAAGDEQPHVSVRITTEADQ